MNRVRLVSLHMAQFIIVTNLPSFIARNNNDNTGLIPQHINNDGIVNVLDDVNLVNLILN